LWTPLPWQPEDRLQSIAKGVDRVLAVREDGALLFDDHGAWRKLGIDTNVWFSAVTYGAGNFVAVGSGGAILTSPDGSNWTNARVEKRFDLQNISFNNGLFLVLGYDYCTVESKMFSSPDGINWAPYVWPGPDWLPSYVGAFQGLFVAVSYPGRILTSLDGGTWTLRASIRANGLSSVAFGKDAFVVVGQTGAILQSDPMISLRLAVSQGGPRLAVSGPSDSLCRLEYSSGLNPTDTWQTAGTIWLTNSPSIWIDSTSGHQSQRFYRAVLLP